MAENGNRREFEGANWAVPGRVGTVATATQAENVESLEKSQLKCTTKSLRSEMSKYAKDNHKRIARLVGYALTLDQVDAWWMLSALMRAHLTVTERTSLTFMALKSLDRDDAMQTVEAAFSGAGQPNAPLFDFVDQAAHWADMADPVEIEAYCLASFKAMTPKRQAAFLYLVQGSHAA